MWDLAQPGSSPSHSPSRQAERVEDLERLEKAFAKLDEQDRQLLSMRRIFDIPVAQIAREIGMPESTVRWRLGVIMAELASEME